MATMREKQVWETYPPVRLLREIGRRWPAVWRQVDSLRADRGRALPNWPEWCYLPMAGALAIATGGLDPTPEIILDLHLPPAVIAASAAWRVGKLAYRFDPDLFRSLVDQSLTGDLPCDILLRLPHYCIYLETPGMVRDDIPVAGFFAHLEHDTNDGRRELRLLLLMEDHTVRVVPVHLGEWTLEEGLRRISEEAGRVTGIDVEGMLAPEGLEPFLQLLLYLCAENADMPQGSRPGRPARELRQLPDIPTRWDVGLRIGAAIRRYENTQTDEPGEGTHASPRPHVRRAHWHHFWMGPKDGERRLVLRWLPPIPVGVDEDELPVTVRRV